MTTLAWPRLPRGRAIELAAGLVALSPHEARLSARLAHPDAEPSGLGRPATEEEVARLQMRLRAVADERGWPRGLSRVDQSAVDRAWGRVLSDELQITPAAAADAGVWSFIALVVVPDLVRWRVPTGPRERFVDTSDHVLGRLWWHAWTLGPDLIDGDGADPLDDDELSAIFRRRDLVANREIARSMVRVVSRRERSGPHRLATFKQLAIDVLHLTPARCLDVLAESELDEVMEELLNSR